MAPPFKSNIQHVKPHEPGKASVPRRPDSQLEQNILYLKDRMDAALLGQALFLRDATVESAAAVGQPVFYNSDTQRFELALAAVETDPVTSTLVASKSADVQGVVYSKTNATLADLLVLGLAPLDISAAVSGAVNPGRYYLSAGQAGMLQQQRPPATVSVLHNLGDGRVLVVPDMKDFLEDHIHFTFALTPRPAGVHTQPVVDSPHVITSPDATKKGWLPASHAIFDGKAPTGAAFGYNLEAHDALKRVWPPIPLSAALLEISKPSNTNLIDQGLQRVPGTLVQFDQHGIWWMTDCYDQVPWPTDFNTESSSSSAGMACPAVTEMEEILSFIRMTFATDKSVVTSLQSESALLEVVDCDGDPAKTGDLKLRLLLDFLFADAGLTGHLVAKGFDPVTRTLQTGPVVEGLTPGANITLTATTTSNGVFQGVVRIDGDFDPLGRELAIELIRLDDVRERFNGIVMYLAFLAEQASGVDMKIKIPPVGLPTDPHVVLRAVLLGDTTGTPAAVAVKRTNVPRPSSPGPLPTVQTAVTFDVPGVGAVTAGDYFEVSSAAIPVVAGDTLFVRLDRAGGDGYSGELGLIRVGAVIQSGP